MIFMAPYTCDDVKMAVHSIGDLQAPGQDGLHDVFFIKYCHIILDEITQEVLFATNSRKIPAEWNDTTIVLIPKTDTTELVTQFRPISLCNVLHKIMSNMLDSCLKNILSEIISTTQSAFVPGRMITDNILIAYECIHKIKNKRAGKTGLCVVKLDMHKAYDRAEWSFLRDMMTTLGFHEHWIEIMMSCVSSIRYKVRFNSQETYLFIPTRRIRHGVPFPLTFSCFVPRVFLVYCSMKKKLVA